MLGMANQAAINTELAECEIAWELELEFPWEW
jgi:hypothetical protein